MIEIEEPPEIQACSGCAKPLRWYWSAHTGQWVAFMPGEDRKPVLHGCRPLQAPSTWRSLAAIPAPGQAGINAAGRARAVEAIKTRTDNEEVST